MFFLTLRLLMTTLKSQINHFSSENTRGKMAVALFLLNRQRQRQRQQQIPRLFRDRTNPLDYMTDIQIVHNYRLDRESIYELCHELEPELARPTRRVHALPVSLQVMIALRYFASGSYMNVIGDAHGVSKMSVSRSIHSIAKKHCQKHWSIYIQYPMTNTERQSGMFNFYDIKSFLFKIHNFCCFFIIIFNFYYMYLR